MKIRIIDRQDAARSAYNIKNLFGSAIQILDPGMTNFADISNNPIRLNFVDTFLDEKSMHGPKDHHIQTLIDFAASVDLENGLIAHCHAGISRSPAAVIIVMTAILGPGSEDKAYDEVLRVRPQAMPNTEMMAIADRLLGRNGALQKRAIEIRKKFDLSM